MTTWTPICRVEDIPVLGARRVARASGLDVAIFRNDSNEVFALLDQFGMTRYADYPAGTLAYGDQRRVEMMRALASGPQFLLLDEPIAGMNDVEAAQLGEIYRDIAASGVGILLIEHNVGFVATHCAQVNVLNLGRLIAAGTPQEVFRNAEVIEAYVGT